MSYFNIEGHLAWIITIENFYHYIIGFLPEVVFSLAAYDDVL